MDVEQYADHAGRRHEHGIRRATHGFGGSRGHVARDLHAGFAGTGVCAAGIHDNRRRHAARFRQMLARNYDGRRDGLVGREHRGRRRLVRHGLIHLRDRESSHRGRRGKLGDRAERQHHGVLRALAEQRAPDAIGGDLLRQPEVRDDREALPDKEPRIVRERAEHFEPRGDGAAAEFANEPSRQPHAAAHASPFGV